MQGASSSPRRSPSTVPARRCRCAKSRPVEPEDPYGIAKYAVECELRACHDVFGLPYVIFRPHNVYGPRQNIGDRYRNVIGIFMNQILQGQPMTIFGDGTQTRAFSYVGDVAPIMAEAIERPAAWNNVFNVGADQPFTLNDLARGGRRRDGGGATDRAPAAAQGGPARLREPRQDDPRRSARGDRRRFTMASR